MDKEKKVVYTVTMKTEKGGTPQFKFTPKVNGDNFADHFKNLLDNFASAYIDLCASIGILRPATEEEKEKNIYVFKTDDRDDVEHKVYFNRKALYDHTSMVFNYILQTEFPDIIYIENCKQYQQEFAFDNKSEAEIELYKQEVKELTDEIRNHYDELLVMIMQHAADEAQQREETFKKLQDANIEGTDA